MLYILRKIIFVIGSSLLVVNLIFPPWVRELQNMIISNENFVYILNEPPDVGWSIDYNSLLLRSIALIIVTLTILMLVNRPKYHSQTTFFGSLKDLFSLKSHSGTNNIKKIQDIDFSSSELASRLRTSLEENDHALSVSILSIIDGVRSPSKQLIELVVDVINNSNNKVKIGAIKVLGNVAFATTESIKVLAICARDDSPDIRETAVLSLQNLGERANYAIPELMAGLSDSNDNVRMWSALALGHFSVLPATTEDTFIHILSDKCRGVREFAAIALAKHFEGRGGAIPILINLAGNKSDIPSARRNALNALGAIGNTAREAIPTLASILEEDERDLQFWTIDTLSRMPTAALLVAPQLIAIAKSPDNSNSSAAMRCLKAMGLLQK